MSTVKKKIKYPTSPMDIPLDTLIKYMDLPDEQKADLTTVLTLFTPLTRDEVQRMDIYAAETICSAIFNALQRMETPMPQKITIDGVEYGAIPDVDEMSFGEYIDLSRYMDDHHDWAKAMAVFYRPIVKKRKVLGRERYEIQAYNGTDRETVQMWLHQPCSFPLAVRSFFLSLGQILEIIMSPSSKEGSTQKQVKKT